jgi:hypothetical protein
MPVAVAELSARDVAPCEWLVGCMSLFEPEDDFLAFKPFCRVAFL